jgi:hypothetical protein
MRRELAALKDRYNRVRLHEAIGYVTPEDERQGRGPTLRKARQDGLQAARRNRIATRRAEQQDTIRSGQTNGGN